MRRIRNLVVGLLVVFLFAGCSEAEESAAGELSWQGPYDLSAPAEVNRERLLAKWDAYTANMDEEQINDLGSDFRYEPSEFQLKIIEDGVVTRSEYLLAYQDWADCMAKRGWSVEANPVFDEATQQYPLQVGGSIAGLSEEEQLEQSDQISLDMYECAEPTVFDIDTLYREQNLLSGAEREASFERFQACVQELGLTDPLRGLTLAEIYTLASDAGVEVWQCVELEPRLFSSDSGAVVAY